MTRYNRCDATVKGYMNVRDILMFVANADHPVTVKELHQYACDGSYVSIRRLVKSLMVNGLLLNRGDDRHFRCVPSVETFEIYGK